MLFKLCYYISPIFHRFFFLRSKFFSLWTIFGNRWISVWFNHFFFVFRFLCCFLLIFVTYFHGKNRDFVVNEDIFSGLVFYVLFWDWISWDDWSFISPPSLWKIFFCHSCSHFFFHFFVFFVNSVWHKNYYLWYKSNSIIILLCINHFKLLIMVFKSVSYNDLLKDKI